MAEEVAAKAAPIIGPAISGASEPSGSLLSVGVTVVARLTVADPRLQEST
jgi:hypothetical protein